MQIKPKMNNYSVEEKYQNMRLDVVLSSLLNISRSQVQTLIKNEHVFVNNKNVSASYKVKLNDIISYEILKEEQNFKSKEMNLNIVYEDDDIIIINKPQGLVIHPSIGHFDDTLVNGLMYKYHDNLSNVNGQYRLGIVHRIDKDTSGLVCIAKNNQAHNFLAQQLKDHTMNREYIALVNGVINEDEAIINLPIARDKNNPLKMSINSLGKEAYTKINVIKRFSNYTLLNCKLKTGRTHQIRVHLAYIGHSVVGDKTYGNKKQEIYNDGQLLHAYKLSFIHPKSNKIVTFEIDLPKYFLDVLSNLK